jgi:cytochrome c-type biogenesis protein CcsB
MEILIILTCIFYIASTIGYAIYLFAQKDSFQKAGWYLLAAGFLVHSVDLVILALQAGTFPARNLFETLLTAGWVMTAVFLAARYKTGIKILGVFAAPLVTLCMLLATQLPKDPGQVKEIFRSFWLIFHVLSVFIGEAAFALACGIGLLYLLQEQTIKTKRHGFFYKRLPSLDQLDAAGYGCIIVGFSFLTLGLVTGFVYAKSVWGRFWGWDPKEVWSGITWLLYAVLLHERLAVGWRGRKSAIMAIIGFIVILFTFFGVNFFMQGHHAQFTQL